MKLFKTAEEKKEARIQKLRVKVAGLKADRDELDRIMDQLESIKGWMIRESRGLASQIARIETELNILLS